MNMMPLNGRTSSPTASMQQYIEICEIGSGSFGRVCKIRRRRDNKVFCWKVLNYGKMGDNEKKQLVNEVNILRELEHEHIVRYYDRIIDHTNKRIYIVMEYCPRGDLATHIKHQRMRHTLAPEKFIWKIAKQIALALAHMSKFHILHRDLKPGNVLLTDTHDIKLGDFGLARTLLNSSKKNMMMAQTNVGTPYYMSPEQVAGREYNGASDVWSLGCMIYELAALRPPFMAQNQLALAMKIKQGQWEKLPGIYSDSLNDFIAGMLNVDPKKRTSIDLVVAIATTQHERCCDSSSSFTPRQNMNENNGQQQQPPRTSLNNNEYDETIFNGNDKEKLAWQYKKVMNMMAKVEERERAVLLREEAVEKQATLLAAREAEIMLKFQEIELYEKCPELLRRDPMLTTESKQQHIGQQHDAEAAWLREMGIESITAPAIAARREPRQRRGSWAGSSPSLMTAVFPTPTSYIPLPEKPPLSNVHTAEQVQNTLLSRPVTPPSSSYQYPPVSSKVLASSSPARFRESRSGNKKSENTQTFSPRTRDVLQELDFHINTAHATYL